MKNKTWIWIVVVVVVIIALFAWGRMASQTAAGTWEDTDIACLAGGHQGAFLHIHPEIRINVNGAPETVPANIGINESCMAEVHTHETDGVIHIESANRGKTFTLGDFFEVWDRELAREGYEMEVTINGDVADDPLSSVIGDKDQVVINYTSSEAGESEENESSLDNPVPFDLGDGDPGEPIPTMETPQEFVE